MKITYTYTILNSTDFTAEETEKLEQLSIQTKQGYDE